jgi:diguanylate cyclase (GGDEF)-like protein/PAS domain S-box-containing protein
MEIAAMPSEDTEVAEAAASAPFPGLRVHSAPTELELYKALLDQMSDGVYVTDRERRFLYSNEAASRLTGYESHEIAGLSCQGHRQCPIGHIGHTMCQHSCTLSDCMNDGATREVKGLLRNKHGRRLPVAVTVQAIRAADGSIVGAVEIFRDDSASNQARRRSEAMERMAYLDPLTKVANRRFLKVSMDTAMREFKVTKAPFGVLMIDLDRFKTINDTFGHTCGDFALKLFAKTLVGALRPTDISGRWGGDEFLAIVRNVNLEVLGELASRLVSTVSRIPFASSEGQPIPLSISVGGALVRPGDTGNALIKRADDLLYKSKSDGRDRAKTT